ncbi:threonine synthase [Alicyclobacillus hesperidum subsp. aegles]|uniref:threonine synthase n=1 Tax=Alicyclobacillus hesperidum TaxID=89784 RepID=UPI000719114B|nr:threonine synthase [Alicyclobacillus hesperidum]KRW92519.1 threonine synthase [Alicyclobacillus tengchongensis]GLG00073.1 threonine synthase [Alicyclobacillus hesperidum subsp. aegles]
MDGQTYRGWPGLLAQYRSFLPVTESTPRLTLHEGNTPLIYAEVLSEQLDCHVYLKFEGANPTGSFKDRGMVMAVAKAKEAGKQTVICASTGNTSASAAAYAARAGMQAVILIPHGYVALGKLAQAVQYGARIVAIRGNFDRALEIVREVAEPLGMEIVNSINPYRLLGQQTAAFEICDVLGRAPDALYIPVGNAGNISAYWMGFEAYYNAGHVQSKPRMFGFEAEGAAAIVRGEPITSPETFATAIRIGNPASWDKAVHAADTSGGAIDFVTDDEIASAYRLIAREGVFAEPASAASVAGLMKRHRQGALTPGETIVCVLTGNGLKDPDSAIRLAGDTAEVVDGDLQSVMAALGGTR